MTKRVKKIIVNGLTISRIIGSCLLPFVFSDTKIPLLIGFLTVLFITDFLDGKLSRYWDVKTIGGRILDPIGDKMLALSCMLILLKRHEYLILLLVLELGVILLNIIRTLKGEVVKSSFIGKVKTWLLSIALIFAVMNFLNPNFVNEILGYLGVETTVFTISDGIVFSAIMFAAGSLLVTFICYLKESIDYGHRMPKSKTKFKSAKEIFVRLFDEEKFLEDSDKPLIEIMKRK